MSKIRVLLVDDEEDYVRTMAERLELRDLTSVVATSGAEALEMVKTGAPDVMVLDLRMPGIDGMEVLERVKEQQPHMQVIILTGHGSDAEEKRARRLGAFDYLQKPADTSRLVDAITAAWHRGRRAAAQLIKESRGEFDRTMEAAAWAEAGVPEMAAARMDEPRTAPAVSKGDTALKVLLVDDEEEYIRTIAERMDMRDLGSSVALSGDQALGMVERDVPDVMVLDLRMPGLDGLEVLSRVKAAYPGVEVVIMTGHGTDEDEEEARRLGACAYLRKPVDFDDLMSAIRRAGDRARQRRSHAGRG
ncbi:MAG TPA: response regulator [Longimicrobiales bacterium]|nr:response regulator [Longimicrobiales bacterium]